MYYLVDIICSIADIFFFNILTEQFFVRRDASRWFSGLTCCLFGLPLVALSFWPQLALLRTLFWIFGGIFFAFLLFKAKPLPAFFSSLAFVAVCSLAEVAVMVFFSLFNLSNQELMEIGNPRILYIIVSHVVELLLVIGIRLIKGANSDSLSVRVLVPVCPSLLINILFCCLLASDISAQNDINPFYLVIALGMLYTSIVIILYTARLQSQDELRHSLELANHHYAMQKEYYEQLHAQQEQTRALWHDMSKYLRAIEADASTETSLHQLQEMVDSIGNVVDVNNRIVSIILNEYIQSAKDADTVLALDVQVPKELSVTAADLYILLGNTLDNALDACGALEKEARKISLQLRLHNGMLFYRITNPYLESHLHRKRNQFHGYGLKNVRECVKRNNGTMEVSAENNIFEVSILINCI